MSTFDPPMCLSLFPLSNPLLPPRLYGLGAHPLSLILFPCASHPCPFSFPPRSSMHGFPQDAKEQLRRQERTAIQLQLQLEELTELQLKTQQQEEEMEQQQEKRAGAERELQVREEQGGV
jgi:hypothetical protein